MVASLGPSRFYGSGLPRPWFYNNNDGGDRVNPPVSILDPLLSWAKEAHWSMGGLSSKRHRLQGRIEGSIQKLRVQKESRDKKRKIERSDLVKKAKNVKRENAERMKKLRDMEEEEADTVESEEEEEEGDLVLGSDSDEDSEEEEEEDDDDEDVPLSVASATRVKADTPLLPKRRARNLVDEFDKMAASEKSNPVVKCTSPVVSKRKSNVPSPKSAAKKTTKSSPVARLTPRRQLQINSSRRSPRFYQMCCSESI